MNKIFKSIYNAVRGKWVVVSEATSSYKQPSKASGGGSNSLLSSESLRVKPVVVAIGACLMMGSGQSFGAPDREFFTIGGIEFHGSYMIDYGWRGAITVQYSPADSQETNWNFATSSIGKTFGWPEDDPSIDRYTDIDLTGAHWESLADGGIGSFVHDTDKTVTFLSKTFDYLAINKGTASIISSGDGHLLIKGGSGEIINAYKVIDVVSDGEGSTAEIHNIQNSTITIEAGSSSSMFNTGSSAINILAKNGGIAKIENSSSNKFLIKGAYGSLGGVIDPTPYEGWIPAIKVLSQNNGETIIENSSNGILQIESGIDVFADAGKADLINSNAGLFEVIFSTNEQGAINGGITTIVNRGKGLFTIKGHLKTLSEGARSTVKFQVSDGAMNFKGSGFTTQITDKDGNTVEVPEYMFDIGATDEGTLIIQNNGGNIKFGSALFKYLVKETYEFDCGGAKAQIINESNQRMEITTDIENRYAIEYMNYLHSGAYREAMEGVAEIINNGGELVISGSNGGYGIGTMLDYDRCEGGSCDRSISQREPSLSYALIKNAKGIMRLEKNAIGNMFRTGLSDKNLAKKEASSTIENHDVMYLAEDAIGDFGVGGKFINKAGATVKANAKALFDLVRKDETTDPDEGDEGGAMRVGGEQLKSISILNKDGSSKTTTVTGYESQVGEQYPEDWSDEYLEGKGWVVGWDTNSVWEDGGHLVITDIAEGTSAANDIRYWFQNRFGTGTTISFKGGVTETAGVTDFVGSTLDTLIARGDVTDGSVLSDVTFSAEGGEFLVGTNGINQDIGFMGVKNASTIKVTDGKTLTLTGGVTNTRMVGEDIPIVLQNGTLQLGDTRLAAGEGTIGSIATDANSVVDVAHGHFSLQNVTGNGHIEVGERGNVMLNTFSTSINNLGVVGASGDITINAVDKSKSKALQYAFRNQGTANLQNVTVTEGAELRNVKDGKTTAKALTLHAGSELTNMGTLDVESLTGWGTIRNTGTINVKGELFVPGQSTQLLSGTVNAGELVIGEKPAEGTSFSNRSANGAVMVQGKTFAEELTFNQGNVQVMEGATLTQGMSQEDYERFTKDREDLVKDKTVLVVDKTFSMADTDNLWVSTLMSDKNLALGDKSLVVMTGNNLKGHAMFEAKDGSTLTADIAEGAEFVFDGNMLGRHYIATGFDDASMDAFGSLTVKDLDGNTTMDVQTNDKGVFVVKGTDRISDIAPDALFQNAFDYVLDAHQDTGSDNAMVAWISKLISANEITNDSLTQATLTLAHAPALAGVQQQGLARTLAIADEVKDYHAKDGLLWASVLHGQSNIEGLDLGFGLDANYDVKTNGLVVGAELPLSQNFAVGTALSYQKSKVEDTGIQNEAETVAGSIYAKQSIGNFTFSESFTVSQGQHDVKGFASTDVDTQVFVIDFEGAYTHTFANGLAVQPYAGLRTSFLKVDDANIVMGGQDMVKHKGETDTFVQMPVGVKVQKAVATNNGWRVMGQAKLGAITTLGDKEAHSTVSAIGFAGDDAIHAQVLDRVTGDFGLNVMAATDNLQLGVGYNFQGSSSVKDHQVKANLRYVF